jgi:hypothetical protein
MALSCRCACAASIVTAAVVRKALATVDKPMFRPVSAPANWNACCAPLAKPAFACCVEAAIFFIDWSVAADALAIDWPIAAENDFA